MDTIVFIYLIGVSIAFLTLIFIDRSDDGSIKFLVPIPSLSKEVVFLFLALLWPVSLVAITFLLLALLWPALLVAITSVGWKGNKLIGKSK